jgi:hypothetical protein
MSMPAKHSTCGLLQEDGIQEMIKDHLWKAYDTFYKHLRLVFLADEKDELDKASQHGSGGST